MMCFSPSPNLSLNLPPYLRSLKGFSLIELAVVLVVLGLIISSLLLPLTAQVEMRRHQDTTRMLREVKEALLGYAAIHGRLPCPASNTVLGQEDAAQCVTEGYLPWADLGVGREDSWRNPLRYRVDEAYIATIPADSYPADGLSIKDLDEKDLIPDDDLSAKNNPAIPNATSRIVVIVFSCGKNGLPNKKNAHSPASNCRNNGSTNAVYTHDKILPHDADNSKNFDDYLVWLSRNQLIYHLERAGKWP